ncbi:hypothetical protein NL351_30755, partial [Klebsiella pneumoniae]|nr:hypothetical protein [Klebsiella pneumoniae]
RAVLTTLVLQQAAALGFKGVVNPNLTSLVTDKKLTLRIIDFLAKKVRGGRGGHRASEPALSLACV